MATNDILTIDMITKEAIPTLHDSLQFPGLVNKQYDDSFAKSGAKIGSTARIRRPARYITGTGKVATAQNSEEEEGTLTVDTQRHVLLEFGSAERALDIDDYAKQFLKPAMEQMASDMEFDLFKVMNQVGPTIIGTGAGTNVVWDDVLMAKSLLSSQTTPKEDRCVIIDPFDVNSILADTKDLQNPGSAIGEQYMEGMIAHTGGFKFFESNHMDTVTLPDNISGVTTAPVGAGAVSIPIDFGVGAAGDIIPAGATLTIDNGPGNIGVVGPETKKVIGIDYEFAVTTEVILDGSGTGVIVITEGLYDTGAKKNATALIGSGAAVTLTGEAGSIYRQSLAFHKDAFTLATVDLPFLWGGVQSSRQEMDGISMRIGMDGEVRADENICRADILYGFDQLRAQQYAVKLWHKIG